MYNLVWFRNDLRIRDNESLAKAVTLGKPIIAVYCFEKTNFEFDVYGFQKTAQFRAQFLLNSVNDLHQHLASFNIPLITSFDTTENLIKTILKNYSIDAVFYQEQWTKEEVLIEGKVKKVLSGIPIHKSYSQFLVTPEEFFSVVKNIPNSFTSFRKKIEKYSSIREEFIPDLSVINANELLLTVSQKVTLQTLGFTDIISDKRCAFPFEGGSKAGLDRLEDYLFKTQHILQYKQTRNGLLGVNYSTKFSPWLADGSLSPVTIYHQVKRFEKEIQANDSTYWVIFELLWRDFFKFISLKYKDAIFFEGGIQRRETYWLQNKELIQSWINGQTSCDFVNANMLELQQTGWMSNRGRQNVASYFTKELYQDWRIGAAYFESMLIDYDVHSNYGNWMYVAGVGNDRRDRKFNTQLQAQKYDVDKLFRKRWLQTQLF